jgi:hypothetical protein
MRRRYPRLHMAGVVIFVIGAIVLTPILLPIALYQHARDEKRMRALVETFACLSCGRVLGAASLNLADNAWRVYLTEWAHKFEGTAIRYRVVKYFDAICPHCGAYHKFVPKQRTFSLLGPEYLPLKPRSEHSPSAN